MTAVPRRTLVQLFKQAWTEIPDIVAGTAVALTGITMGLIGLNRHYKNDGDNRRYKNTYIIMRSDDPRAALVHKD